MINRNRHARRRDLARFRRASSASLLTYLVEPGDNRLSQAPLLKVAAHGWLASLSTRVRSCIVCSAWLVNRDHVGAMLLAMPGIAKPTSASTCGICCQCWDADLPDAALDRACATALNEAVPGGWFEEGRR
ncbi:hypothetical protein [Bradyrhizobium sp. McL0616]|uniref:hypothetical protein n=1 Tax=Bradyrhizobium sp. McL0616 TaxID=3415674 RepID=UPI003CE99096